MFGLLLVPLLLVAYLLQQRRRRRGAVVFSSVALVRAAMPKRASWKRYVPAALFLLGLMSLGVASARPQASAKIAVSRTSIILALDVSRSMCSTDVAPNRLSVAQEAARSFVEKQPKGTRIGIVEFAGFALVLVEPTTEREKLLAAIDGLTTARGTAIGSAILRSVDVISAINPQVPPVDSSIESGAGDSFPGFDPATGEPIESAPVLPAVPAPKEGYVSDIVVVLTDGTNTRGIAPIDAANLTQYDAYGQFTPFSLPRLEGDTRFLKKLIQRLNRFFSTATRTFDVVPTDFYTQYRGASQAMT